MRAHTYTRTHTLLSTHHQIATFNLVLTVSFPTRTICHFSIPSSCFGKTCSISFALLCSSLFCSALLFFVSLCSILLFFVLLCCTLFCLFFSVLLRCTLFCSALLCSVYFSIVLSAPRYFALPYSVLFIFLCSTLFCSVLLCSTLFCSVYSPHRQSREIKAEILPQYWLCCSPETIQFHRSLSQAQSSSDFQSPNFHSVRCKCLKFFSPMLVLISQIVIQCNSSSQWHTLYELQSKITKP
jgi:hypothetical protein